VVVEASVVVVTGAWTHRKVMVGVTLSHDGHTPCCVKVTVNTEDPKVTCPRSTVWKVNASPKSGVVGEVYPLSVVKLQIS